MADLPDTKVIEEARMMYANDNIQIDDDAKTSVAEDGTWVQAWVWVPND